MNLETQLKKVNKPHNKAELFRQLRLFNLKGCFVIINQIISESVMFLK